MTPMSVAGVARRTHAGRGVEAAACGAAAASPQRPPTANSSRPSRNSRPPPHNSRPLQRSSRPPAAAPGGRAGSGRWFGNTLPGGCGRRQGGVEYQKCGGVYYRAAFQGNNLVYVVTQP